MGDVPDVCGRITQKVIKGVGSFKEGTYPIDACGLAHLEKEFSKGELIFGPYDTEGRVFEIREGEVEIFQLSPDGKKVIIDILIPGNIFSNSPFSADHNVESHDFARARSRVVLCVLWKSDFMKALKTQPELAVSFILEISAKLNEADDRIRDLALSNSRIRLVSELMRLGRRFGIEFDDKIVLKIKLSHEEIAEMIGASRETVTRMLIRLRQKKIISLDKYRHIIIDKNKAHEIYSSQ